jgi:hypothetical protein
MKNRSLVYLLFVFLSGALTPAYAQSSAARCFRADWLQGARVVNLRVDGEEVSGTFTVEGDDGAATYEFTGSLKGDKLTVAFAGGRLPDVAPSEMKSLVWSLVRDGGRELLRIRFRGRNYRTNRYEDYSSDFEPCDGAGHDSPPAAEASGRHEEGAISLIRQRYAAVNRGLPKYRAVKKELSGFSTEGGELVAYFDGPTVMKLSATHYGETGRSLEEFYYWEGKLIFAFRKRDTYDRPMSGKVSKTAEDRFYFNDGVLIRWVDERGRRVAPGGGDYLEAQARNNSSSKQLLGAALSPETTIEAPEPNP